MLVYGEESKMTFLKRKIHREFGIDCYMPANGEAVSIVTDPNIPSNVSANLVKAATADVGQCWYLHVSQSVINTKFLSYTFTENWL